jgi:hypothetical protein
MLTLLLLSLEHNESIPNGNQSEKRDQIKWKIG